MNFKNIKHPLRAVLLFLAFANISAWGLTDQEALELGMTPLEVVSELEHRARVEYDTTGVATAKELNQLPDELKAEVVIVINKAPKGTSPTAQKALVYHKGYLVKTIEVSTGKETRVTSTSGKVYLAITPLGYFRPTTIWKEYQSATWVGAHMNFAIFFINGIALHATTPDHFKKLGSRDSGGCVRMRPESAEWLNELVLDTGNQNYELRPITLTAGNIKIERTRVLGGATSVAAVARASGLFSTKTVKSWDTLIIVRDIRTP